MRFKELLESEILFECILNEENFKFFKKYSDSSRKKTLIDFICKMFEQHSLEDKGIEFMERNAPNRFSLEETKDIFNVLNKTNELGKLYISVEKNTTDKSTGSVFILTLNSEDTKNILGIQTEYGIYIKFLISKIKTSQSKKIDGEIFRGTRDGYEISSEPLLNSDHLRICFISSKPAEYEMRR